METTKYWRRQGWEQACMWAAYTWERVGRSLSGGNSEKNGFGGWIHMRESGKKFNWRKQWEQNGFGGEMKDGVVGMVMDMVDWEGGEHDGPVVSGVWKSMLSLSLMRLGSKEFWPF